MKIKKNGKVINLTESDLKRIVKRTLNEQSVGKEVVDGLFDKITQLKDMYADDIDKAIEWVESSGVQDKMKELLSVLISSPLNIPSQPVSKVGSKVSKQIK